jgi:hypothetical protein
MALPRQRYLDVEGARPELRSALLPLVRAINDHNTDMHRILAGGISPDNLRSTRKTVRFTGGESLTVKHGLPTGSRPYRVDVCQAIGLDLAPISTGSPAWLESGDSVVISFILGVAATFIYDVTLQIHGT